MELEARAAHGGWRADVLVTAPSGARTALEAQVSSASVDDVLERTRRYRPAGPDGPFSRLHPLVRRFSVVACAEVCDPSPFWHGPIHAGWDHGEERAPRFVAAVLHGHLVPRTATTALGTRYDGWAAPEDVTAADEYAASTGTTPPAPA